MILYLLYMVLNLFLILRMLALSCLSLGVLFFCGVFPLIRLILIIDCIFNVAKIVRLERWPEVSQRFSPFSFRNNADALRRNAVEARETRRTLKSRKMNSEPEMLKLLMWIKNMSAWM